MKKIFLIVALAGSLISQATNPPADVTERILKAFHATFRAARQVSWHEYNDYYQANFRIGEIQVRAQYSDDGTLLKNNSVLWRKSIASQYRRPPQRKIQW